MDNVPLHAQKSKPIPETTFIYALKDPETHLIRYVGKANDPQIRLRKHLKEKYKSIKNSWLQSLKAKGLIPELMILEEVPVSQWQEQERYWIAYGREQGWLLVNGTDGGDGVHGWKPTEERRAQLREAMRGNQYGKGHKLTSEQKARQSAALKGHPVSPEAAEKIAASKRGKPRSPETIARVSASLTGRKLNEATVAKMRGRTISEVHRAKISAIHKGKTISEKTRAKLRGRPVSQKTRDKISLANTGHKQTEEQKQANRDRAINLGLRPPSRKGIPMPPEAIAKRKATLLTKNQAEIEAKVVLGNAIRVDHTSGMIYRELVEKYGISKTQVARVVRGEAWK